MLIPISNRFAFKELQQITDIKKKNNIVTYVGPKGYTILTNSISKEQITKLKKALTVTPKNPSSPIPSYIHYPLYRESTDKSKLFIPFFYAKQMGFPINKETCTSYLSPGENIQVTFKGELRDYQKPVIDAFMEQLYANREEPITGGLLELPCGWGKTAGTMMPISLIGKKTAVIVHKEFLADQWVERIQLFLPDARVGRIQGDCFDIENKDIVIIMLQTLCSRQFPINSFSSFGLLIVDEVHHIASEHFSKALFQIVVPWVIGLSATMNRKDGTSWVFQQFLGPVIQKVERNDSHIDVEIRPIFYQPNNIDETDPQQVYEKNQFLQTILDSNENVMYSSMTTKICEYPPYIDFVYQTLANFIQIPAPDFDLNKYEKWKQQHIYQPPCKSCHHPQKQKVRLTCCNCSLYCYSCAIQKIRKPDYDLYGNIKIKKLACPECKSKKNVEIDQIYIPNPWVEPMEKRQTIIFATNRSILDELYKRIVDHNLCSVGYYVGSGGENKEKKRAKLKASELKQVVLATYSMASDGLDIPTLNAEFMITSKTDIEQSMGRVLRKKHDVPVIIYDFVCPHPCFIKQYKKRCLFYKKHHYPIIQENRSTNSIASTSMDHDDSEEDTESKKTDEESLRKWISQNMK